MNGSSGLVKIWVYDVGSTDVVDIRRMQRSRGQVVEQVGFKRVTLMTNRRQGTSVELCNARHELFFIDYHTYIICFIF